MFPFARSAVIELDVNTRVSPYTESIYFQTGGQVFGGTLALNVIQLPDGGDEFKVVHALDSTGEFVVTGGGVFTEIDQTANGVVCRR